MGYLTDDHRGQCAGKTAYPNPQKANAQVRRVKKRGLRPGSAGVNAYKCEICAQWHVGGRKFKW